MKRKVTIEGESDAPISSLIVTAIDNTGKQTSSNVWAVDDQNMLLNHVDNKSTAYILPEGTVWVSDDRRSLIVIKPPRQYYIPYQDGIFQHRYRIWLPFLAYGISFRKDTPYVSHIWMALNEQCDTFYPVPIPNVFNTGRICTHVIGDDSSNLTIEQKINRAFNDFWFSNFNGEVEHLQSHPLYRAVLGNHYEDYRVTDYLKLVENYSLEEMMYELKRVAKGCYQYDVYYLIADVLSYNDRVKANVSLPTLLINDICINSAKSKI